MTTGNQESIKRSTAYSASAPQHSRAKNVCASISESGGTNRLSSTSQIRFGFRSVSPANRHQEITPSATTTTENPVYDRNAKQHDTPSYCCVEPEMSDAASLTKKLSGNDNLAQGHVSTTLPCVRYDIEKASDFELLDYIDCDQAMEDELLSLLQQINESYEQCRSKISEKVIKKAASRLDCTVSFFNHFDLDQLVESLYRVCTKPGLNEKMSFQCLEHLIDQVSTTYQQVIDITATNHPVRSHLGQLSEKMKMRKVQFMLDSLEGTHHLTHPHPYWVQSNKKIVQQPTQLNKQGLAKQFDIDLRRHMNFLITNKKGEVLFCSTKERNKQNNTSDDQLLETCSGELIKLCSGKRKSLLGIASELASQMPYNFLFTSFSTLLKEKFTSDLTITAPKVIETQFSIEGESSIKATLLVAFPIVNIVHGTDCQHYEAKQPVMISSSITLDANNLDNMKLDTISLKIPAVSEISQMG